MFFDDKANQHKAIEMIMEDGMFGFSNHATDSNSHPSLAVFYLDYHEEGLLKLFQDLSERNCLVIRVNAIAQGEIKCIERQNRLLRKIIGE